MNVMSPGASVNVYSTCAWKRIIQEDKRVSCCRNTAGELLEGRLEGLRGGRLVAGCHRRLAKHPAGLLRDVVSRRNLLDLSGSVELRRLG